MALYSGKEWTKADILSYIGDPEQIAGARPSILMDGKAEGVKAVNVNTGGGLNFTVLPGRGMDIAEAFYKGKALHFISGTGITSPSYYEEPGINWLRSFFAGLLTTCGITYSGAPDFDQGASLGLHGRISNTGAENLCINQKWKGNDYVITIQGMVKEVMAMGENMTLTRRIETRLGWKGFKLIDLIENRGFEPQPLMMIYHFNFGFPLLSSKSRIIGPVIDTQPRDEEAKKDKGIEDSMMFPEPQANYKEKVFFHNLASDSNDHSFIALFNENVGDGTPLGILIKFNKKELPKFTEWKMPRKGSYVIGLEPGTVIPIGRSRLREKGDLPFLEAQDQYSVTIDLQVIDSLEEMKSIEREAELLKSR